VRKEVKSFITFSFEKSGNERMEQFRLFSSGQTFYSGKDSGGYPGLVLGHDHSGVDFINTSLASITTTPK
jgi:hypothetical protein